jgi:hypothetical protein
VLRLWMEITECCKSSVMIWISSVADEALALESDLEEDLEPDVAAIDLR